jgi:hypothetical protein
MPRTACRIIPLLLLAGVIPGLAVAAELAPGPGLAVAEFVTLSEALADALAFPMLSSAAGLGTLGFEAVVATGGPAASSSAGWWRNGVAGDPTLGVMTAPRAILRKGLPGRLDLGAQGGKVLGNPYWGVEGRWSVLEGGVLTPAVAVRGSHSRLTGAPLDVEVSEVSLAVSKGVGFFTPYAAVGYRWTRADGRWGDEFEVEGRHRHQRVVARVGLRTSLGPVFVVVEAFQSSRRGVLAGAGVRL